MYRAFRMTVAVGVQCHGHPRLTRPQGIDIVGESERGPGNDGEVLSKEADFSPHVLWRIHAISVLKASFPLWKRRIEMDGKTLGIGIEADRICSALARRDFVQIEPVVTDCLRIQICPLLSADAFRLLIRSCKVYQKRYGMQSRKAALMKADQKRSTRS